jgi:hypothetical protein
VIYPFFPEDLVSKAGGILFIFQFLFALSCALIWIGGASVLSNTTALLLFLNLFSRDLFLYKTLPPNYL